MSFVKKMKSNKLFLVFTFVIGAMLLSACGGVMGASSWPGITATDDTVFVAYATDVLALNAGSGTQVWRYPEKAEGSRSFFAPPTVNGEQLIVGDYTNKLSAVSLQNGSERWVFTAEGRFIGSSLVVDDLILAPSNDHHLYALNNQGQVQWKFEADHGLWGTPAVDGEVVYLPSMDHFLYALRMNNGQEIWRTDVGGAIVHSPELSDDGRIYIGTLSNEVVALDTNGNIRWRIPTDNAVWTRPALYDGVIYYGDLNGTIYAVNADSGSVVWRKDLGSGAVVGSAVIVDDQIIFGTENGELYAFGPGGEARWNRAFNGKLYSSPVVAGNRIIIGIVQGDNLVIALDSNGSELWKFTPAK
jgi:eukaryotic-like serine/threonine-protein kinase